MKNPIYSFFDFIKNLVDLKGELDVEGTVYEIRNNKSMTGPNAWMLMCSIVIASLGLDLNSPAVIIGAMLISPLMSPILGIGLGVGIADMDTIKKSLAHFGIAILIALIASTIYFRLSPLGVLTDQIFYRTEPTLLDVMIAFFGGIAGIVSSSRKDKTNAIPGVAIATALMPPLCVTGFGIANWDTDIILSSFYLFFLNSFFVALSTYLMVRYLNFPLIKLVDRKSKRRAIAIASFISILLVVPSVFILKNIFQKVKLEQSAHVFIEDYFKDREAFIDSYKMIPGDPNRLLLKVYGTEINYSDTSKCQLALEKSGLKGTKLQILSTSEINLDEFEKLEAQVSGMTKIDEQYRVVQQAKNAQDVKIDSLVNTIQILTSDTLLFTRLKQEVKMLYPAVEYFALGKAEATYFSGQDQNHQIAIVSWKKGTLQKDILTQEKRMEEYIQLRTGRPQLEVITKSNK